MRTALGPRSVPARLLLIVLSTLVLFAGLSIVRTAPAPGETSFAKPRVARLAPAAAALRARP